LRIHIHVALTNGCTREAIVEVLLQTAIDCGAPAARLQSGVRSAKCMSTP